MRKLFRIAAVGLVAALALAIAPARADVTITIDQANGDTLYSLPDLPDGAPAYPAELSREVTGTVTFNTPACVGEVPADPCGSGVTVTMVGPFGDKSQQATLSCDEAGLTCDYSAKVLFFVMPGDYEIQATATDVDETVVQTQKIKVTVL